MTIDHLRRNFLQKLVASAAVVPILSSTNAFAQSNRAGADECFVKPVNPSVLVLKAMAWLGHGHRSEKQTQPISVTL